jgi:hypothetical protein
MSSLVLTYDDDDHDYAEGVKVHLLTAAINRPVVYLKGDNRSLENHGGMMVREENP